MTNHINYLLLAKQYLSGYKNSVSKTGHGPFRKHVLSLRTAIYHQLSLVVDELTDIKSKNDISMSLKLCEENFENLYRIISLEWPDLIEQIEKTIEDNVIESHLIYINEPLNGTSGLSSGFDHLIASVGYKKYAVTRIVMAKFAFLKALPSLNEFRDLDQHDFIKRVIKFEPEFKQSGVSILSYFSNIISTKYPGLDVSISIEQQGNLVTLIVELPDGSKELIEQELHEYGLVVLGNKSPESYLDDPLQAMMLKNKLEISALEAKQTRELLYSERAHYSSRIDSLEKQIEFLTKAFDSQQNQLYQSAEYIRTSSTTESEQVTLALNTIAELIENNSYSSCGDEISSNLSLVQQESPTVIDKINELIIKGSISGAAGNFLYSAIQAVSRLA